MLVNIAAHHRQTGFVEHRKVYFRQVDEHGIEPAVRGRYVDEPVRQRRPTRLGRVLARTICNFIVEPPFLCTVSETYSRQ